MAEGVAHMEMKKHSLALECFKRAAKLDPSYPGEKLVCHRQQNDRSTCLRKLKMSTFRGAVRLREEAFNTPQTGG